MASEASVEGQSREKTNVPTVHDRPGRIDGDIRWSPWEAARVAAISVAVQEFVSVSVGSVFALSVL